MKDGSRFGVNIIRVCRYETEPAIVLEGDCKGPTTCSHEKTLNKYQALTLRAAWWLGEVRHSSLITVFWQ